MRITARSSLRLLFPALLLLSATGCIRSRLLVESDPPGAAVSFQHQERGETPVAIPFIWYWYYDVKVSKPGFRTVEKVEYLPAPPWLIMPLDFFAELLPFPVYNTHHRRYVLEPLPVDQTPAPAATAAPTSATLTPAPQAP